MDIDIDDDYGDPEIQNECNLKKGQIIGNYIVEKRIGSGSQGRE